MIRKHLGGFDRRYESLQRRLQALAHCPDTVIHGDLVPDNILVDERARPVAVLDFGFLTTAGDPRLDAAIAAGLLNMYGPYAPAITDALTARVAQGCQCGIDLGYAVDVLLIYQAAYADAVLTANAFTSDGSDGHFAWCIDQLRPVPVTPSTTQDQVAPHQPSPRCPGSLPGQDQDLGRHRAPQGRRHHGESGLGSPIFLRRVLLMPSRMMGRLSRTAFPRLEAVSPAPATSRHDRAARRDLPTSASTPPVPCPGRRTPGADPARWQDPAAARRPHELWPPRPRSRRGRHRAV